jgi:hypothetical protein
VLEQGGADAAADCGQPAAQLWRHGDRSGLEGGLGGQPCLSWPALLAQGRYSLGLGGTALGRLDAAFAAQLEADTINIRHIQSFILHLREQAQLA